MSLCHADPHTPGPNYLKPHVGHLAFYDFNPLPACIYCGKWIELEDVRP